MNTGWENLGEDELKDRAVPKPHTHINEGAGQTSGALTTKVCTLRVAPERDRPSTGQRPRRG